MSNDIEMPEEATITTTSQKADTTTTTTTTTTGPSSPPVDTNTTTPPSSNTTEDAKTENGNRNTNEQENADTTESSNSGSDSSLSEDSVMAAQEDDDAQRLPHEENEKEKGDGVENGDGDGGNGDTDGRDHPSKKAVVEDGTVVEEEVQTVSCSSSSVEDASQQHQQQQEDESSPHQQQQQQQQQNQTSQIELLQQQIKTLTLERDSALSQLITVNDSLLNLQSQTNQTESTQQLLLSELQNKLQTQTKQKAELEHQYHTLQKTHTLHLDTHSNLEDELEQTKANVLQITSTKTALENEVTTLRTLRDTNERTQAVLQTRLNDAKKKEAQHSNNAKRLQVDNENVMDRLHTTDAELKRATAAKEKLTASLEKLKRKVVERVKASEAALSEERNLNEERKKKMKVFVEQKAEELKNAKSLNDELRAELSETKSALENVRKKVEVVGEECAKVQNRNRDLVKEVTRMKKNSEQLQQTGDSLEQELHKSTQETEEHKSKRQTAKYELMSMLKKLEAEQAVCSRLMDVVKFTFTPKALSQQQLLKESLRDFEAELVILSRKLGKPLPPSVVMDGDDGEGTMGLESVGSGGGGGDVESSSSSAHGAVGRKGGKRSTSRSEVDSSRLISNLEYETQSVSKCIMALGSAVERLHLLLDDSGDKSCVTTINNLLLGMTSQAGNKEAEPQVIRRAGAMGRAAAKTNVERHGLVQSQIQR